VIPPTVAEPGTVARMEVSLATVKEAAAAPLNATAVAPVKWVPVRVTGTPAAPLAGLKPLMAGSGITVKAAELAPVPPGVVTPMAPEAAPAGTVALMEVSLATENVTAAVPLKVTAVAPVRWVPVIVTESPILPMAGRKLETVGAGTKVKAEELIPVPPRVVTLIGPVLAPAGTVALMEVALATENVVADVALNRTAVAPVRLTPVIVTEVPAPPAAGRKLATVGAGTKVKTQELIPVPLGAVTLIVPVLAPEGRPRPG